MSCGRYVVDHDLVPYRNTGKFSGTHTTYRWNTKTATWSKVSTKRAGLISDAYAQQKYGGVFGVTFSLDPPSGFGERRPEGS